MPASAIASAAATEIGDNKGNVFGQLSTEEFIGVLIEELRQQDPFDPQDSQALLEQLSSLRNIESQMELQDQLESLVLQNQVSAAGGMIGKVVQGRDSNNDSVSGRVESVRVEKGKPILELESGKSVAMDNITKVSDLGEDLVGMGVEARRGEESVSGIVTSVHKAGGQSMLELDSGSTVTLDQVTRVFSPEEG